MNSTITHYPVGKGDCSYIKTADNLHLIIDCNFRKKAEEDNDEFDVKGDLLNLLLRKELPNAGVTGKVPFTHVFVNSHADEDHCKGFGEHFYCGDPDNYDNENKRNGEIVVGEIWINRRIFENNLQKEAIPLRKEVKRRRELYKKGTLDKNDNPLKNKHGNRLKIIGYDGDENLEDVPHKKPSETVTKFAGNSSNYLSLFIHAPFKKDLVKDKADKNRDRNPTSIVFQARFKHNKDDQNFPAKMLMGGDADHYIWKEVKDKSEANGNKHALKYDILLAPHHCSWSFFNDVPYTDRPENQEPQNYSLDLLEYKKQRAYIVSSSPKVVDDGNNPPHLPARKEYVNKVGASNFLCTDDHQKGRQKEPIVFEILSYGPRKKGTESGSNSSNTARQGALAGIGSRGDKPYHTILNTLQPLSKNQQIKLAKKDIKRACEQYPGLAPLDNHEIGCSGTIKIWDKGQLLDSYEVKIVLTDGYPYMYPKVFELEGKIKREIDHHCMEDGLICIAPGPIQKQECRRGLLLPDFIHLKLIPHLAQQTHKNEYGYYPNGEYSHYGKGILESYKEIVQEEDSNQVIHLMEKVVQNDLPGRNDPCFCESGLKFKNCHHKDKIEELKLLGFQQVHGDLKQICNAS